MSFYTLRDEYNVGTERSAKWTIFGGVSNELTFVENILASVSSTASTFTYNILGYVSKEFTFAWDIWHYVSRESIFLYKVAMDFGGKVKYSFLKSRAVTRFFRRTRVG